MAFEEKPPELYMEGGPNKFIGRGKGGKRGNSESIILTP